MAYRNRNDDWYEKITLLLTFVIIWAAYKGYLFIKPFYENHPVWFLVIMGICFSWIIAVIFFVWKKRGEKWLALERIEDMQKLHWREFEQFIAFVLKKKGFKTKLGAGTKDGWVDIEASLDGRKYLVQCKKWNKYKISEPSIREFLGAISDFDIDAKGIYVTTSRLTADAKAFALRNEIDIWDKFSLESYVKEFIWKDVASEDSPEKEISENILCSLCSGKMVERVAKHWANAGQNFLGCENYPKCKNIINL